MTDQLKLSDLRQAWLKPSNPLPIIIFGAGSIVTDAHLPAYKNGGFTVQGIYDPDLEKAQKVAQEGGIIAYSNIEEAIAQEDVLFDLATPPQAHFGILEKLPDGAVALLQKPMGNDLDEASRIVSICEGKNIRAAVNFQLRFSPMMLALKDAADKGFLGDIVDFDAWLALDTPWHLWEFLLKSRRVELSLHSIHYLDFIRSLLGNPQGIHAKTMGHPSSKIAQTRTSAILDYGDEKRCALSINHNHSFGRRFQACEFRICGTKGAAYVKLGVNLDYPHGEPDELWLNSGEGWQQVPLHGAWFPDAFTHRMAQLQRYATGEEEQLISNVQDGWDTMALVEAAYLSSSLPSTPIAKRD